MSLARVSASLIAANYLELAKDLKRIAAAGVDFVHCDVMDGNFVPNIACGFEVLKAVASSTKLPLDVHLMVLKPERLLDEYLKFKPHFLAFHVEATEKHWELIGRIAAAGSKAGVVVDSGTPPQKVFPFLEKVQMVCVMSVRAGFAGQKFAPAALEKVRMLAAERKKRGLRFLIEVDGGITEENAKIARAAGADILVSASTIFRSTNLKKTVSVLKGS